jgi:acyl-coenzyme A synthetase/AMP-(fatty) acid ligase
MEGFAAQGREAIVWSVGAQSYRWMLEEVAVRRAWLDAGGVQRGAVVAVEADYSPRASALILALIERGAIAVPLSSAVAAEAEKFHRLAQTEWIVHVGASDELELTRTGRNADHALYATLRKDRDAPGLVLFSSGSTGENKGVVHDFVRLLEKFEKPKQTLRTLTFLLLDHIGGINTLLYTMSNGGLVVVARDHTPDAVSEAIHKHRVELLPTSPTFLNLLLVSGAIERHDLSSLRLVTYGTEPMPESTLNRIADALPKVELQQTYGLSELGILRSKSLDRTSLLVKVGGEGYETRIVDGVLHIRARSAMLGYLNAPSPFDADGWMNTQDEVEQVGEYLRIKGRRSEIINVGGQKVYPAEVESVIALLPNVKDVVVRGEPHPITGQIVSCRVNLVAPEDPREFRTRLRSFCREKLAPFKVPAKIDIVDSAQYNARHKRVRR